MKKINILIFALVTTFACSSKAQTGPFLEAIYDVQVTQDVVYESQVVGQVRLPDWDSITFEDFPPVSQGGSLSSEFNSYVGYDLSRHWLAGDSVVDILKLGDLEEAFAIQEFTVGEIISITGTDAEDISLSSFELVQDQSLSELVEAVPGSLVTN